MVGFCGHIASVIWYLASGRHQESLHSVLDRGQYIDDASVIPEPVDASESVEEGVEE